MENNNFYFFWRLHPEFHSALLSKIRLYFSHTYYIKQVLSIKDVSKYPEIGSLKNLLIY